MKLKIAMLAACLMLAGNSQAHDTNPPPPVIDGPGMEVIKFLGASSNMMFATFGIYDAGSKRGGAGLAMLYRISDYVSAGMRFDYLSRDGDLDEMWMPSGQFQLQAPFVLFGRVEAVPFIFSGVATPIAGQGADNGTFVGIVGSGLAVRVAKHWDIVYDVEKWMGGGFTGLQHRAGFLYKF